MRPALLRVSNWSVTMRAIFIILSMLLVVGCSIEPQRKVISVESVKLNEKFYSDFRQDIQNGNKSEFYLSSYGGVPSVAISVGEYIEQHSIQLHIIGECLSACAEIILPYANGMIKMRGEPLIGFHWGPFMNKALLEKYGYSQDRKNCRWENVKQLETVYNKSSLNPSFWIETFDRLVLIDFKEIEKNGACPWHSKSFENHMWLPNSNQLKHLWGVEYDGLVCADNVEGCKNKIDRRWIKGTRIVIGDEIYVSQGST